MIDPTAARLEREFKHARPLIGCRFDPSGRFLFASAEDDSIQRFDLLTGAKTALVGHKSWVRGMAFVAASPTGYGRDSRRGSSGERDLQALAGFAGRDRCRSRSPRRSRSSPATTTAS